MPSPRRSRTAAVLTLALALVVSLLVGPAAAQPVPRAFDYRSNPGLSAPDAGPTARSVHKIKAHDGLDLYVEVVKPTTGGPFPVILEASPYHGTLHDRDGTRILPEPKVGGSSIGLTGFFAPRGYAVAMMDLRGTGRSQGCLDHLGPNDAKDLRTVVEWLADQSWSTGRVGMTGHSYVGSTPAVAAAQNPRGLVTIVPSAGLASMYDHQFQAGVPYNLQYAGPIFAYETLSMQRSLPPGFTVPVTGGSTGDNFGNDPHEFGCGWANSAALAGEGQASGQYQAWHGARDWARKATKSPVSAFLVHGVNDNAARIPAADWFMERGGRPGDKAWIGQWDHGSGCCPTRRGLQWPFALLAWFDHELKGKDVDTGPAVEVFVNDAATLASGITNGGKRETLQASGYPTLADSTLKLHPVASGLALSPTVPAEAGSSSFAGDARGQVSGATATGGVSFTSAPFASDVVIAGLPELDLVASVSVPRVTLIANVFLQNPSGSLRRISQFAINPELRNGIATWAPVVPGQRMELEPPGFAMGQRVPAGHRLVLRVTTSDSDKVATWSTDPNVTVFTGPGGTALRLPVVSAPTLVADDVPLS